MSRQWFNSMDRYVRSQFTGQDEVITNRRADIDETTIGGKALDEINENILLFRFVDVVFPVTFALFVEQMIVVNPNAIIKSVNGPFHRRRKGSVPGSTLTSPSSSSAQSRDTLAPIVHPA